MKVYYHQTERGNVGDDMNAVLWRRILPDIDQLTSADWLIGAGTILDERLNALHGCKVVMGSGFRPGGESAPGGDIRFAAVRGFLTAERCGLSPDVAVCDPGFLVNRLWPVERRPDARVAFIPHVYSEQYSHITDAAADAGFEVISPTLPLEQFLQRLGACSRAYCESLHSAIFADAMRVPWARVRVCSSRYEGRGVADFKWADTFSVLDTPSAAMNRSALIPIKRSWEAVRSALRPLQEIAERRLIAELKRRGDDSRVFQLSNEGRMQERVEELISRAQQLRSSDDVDTWRGVVLRKPSVNSTRTNRPALRVLAFPKGGANAYLQNFSGALEAAGATVDEFDFWRAFFRRYDVVHIHWPDTHLRTHSWWRALGKHARLGLMCLVLRARGTKVVWMMHNLKAHEKDHPISAWLFPRWFPQLCTDVIALTGVGLASARRLYPALQSKPSAIVPHGHYRDSYPQAPSRKACRERLGLAQDRFTFLFFGNIRRYKNVPLLIDVFKKLADSDAQLVIAGLPVLGMEAKDLLAQAAGDERIQQHLKFIPDDEVPTYLGAADVLVLPFDSILNSGSVLLALSFNRAVLAPRLGALPEIQAEVGPRWLRLYDGALTPQLLAEVKAEQSIPAENEVADLSAFDWDRIGATTLDFYAAAPKSVEPVSMAAEN